MSKTPTNDSRSIDLIRKLLERNLVNRAVLLGEGRWPGSGPFIELAAEWSNLTPDQRATRLRDIGPDGLERARALADVHPEIGRVIDSLEAQGILSHEPEPIVDERDNEDLDEPVATVPSELAKQEAAVPAPAEEGSGANLPRGKPPLPQVAEPVATEPLLAAQSALIGPPTEQLLRPVVDEEAIAAAEAILKRVHERVERTADRIDAIPEPPTHTDFDLPDIEVQRNDMLPDVGVTTDVPRRRIAEFRRAARAADMEYTEVHTAALSRQELFGRLERTGRGVETTVGALPLAASRPGVVVVVGNVLPALVERLREGYCDIPGTRSTVRVHPESRIVLAHAG